MKNKSHMTIKAFSMLTGIKKENLRFYDQSGLLCPEIRGENGYRYYSRHQLNSAYLISDLRELKLGLAEIRDYATHRTPDKLLTLFEKQEAHVQAEIEHLQDIRDIMKLRKAMVHEARLHPDQEFLIRECNAEPIFLCPVVVGDMDEDETCIASYAYAFEHHVNLSNPLGVKVSADVEHVTNQSGDLQYYFKSNRTRNSKKPKGAYAIVYGRCHNEDIYQLCAQLLSFVKEAGYATDCDIYVEWLLDELAIEEHALYHIRAQVRVVSPIAGCSCE